MLSKMFRGLFRQPKDLPEPFLGEPFAILDDYARKNGIPLKAESAGTRSLVDDSVKVVFSQEIEHGIIKLLSVTRRPHIELSNTENFDVFFSLVKFDDGIVYLQRSIRLWNQGEPYDTISKIFDHLNIFVFNKESPDPKGHFRPYLNGRTFGYAWEAFQDFMGNIKGDRMTSQDGQYVSFDTGGLPIGIQKSKNPQEVIISYDLRDYEGLYAQHREQILDLINSVALRHRQICFLIDRERLLICNKFYVSPETDALNLFTAQLQAIHDALLDYLTTVQEAPETAWLREARAAYLRQQPRPQA